MENKEQSYMINDYLHFKERCIENKITNIDEIIKLFEVWLHLLEST